MINACLVFMKGKTTIIKYNDRLTERCTKDVQINIILMFSYFIKIITDFTAKRYNLKVFLQVY